MTIPALAFYLPQYHPIPENDQWWGPGFTDWHNVRKARPLFPGHDQPHQPGELGYYDLRSAEVRQRQADLARGYGISGFCYYYYWFHGRSLLELPLKEMLARGKPDFPFCLCWANENWTRRWDGQDSEILIQQTYSPEDDVALIRSLLPAFSDPRYFRYKGKPLFLVYRPDALPNAFATTQRWRDITREEGIGELFLVAVETFQVTYSHPGEWGFDAALDFQPDFRNLGIPTSRFYGHSVYDYEKVVKKMIQKKETAYRRFPCVMPGWDNSARRKEKAIILQGSLPEIYERWLWHVVQQEASQKDPLIFLNAWNEWAEGNHLEPDLRFAAAYLEATRRLLCEWQVTS